MDTTEAVSLAALSALGVALSVYYIARWLRNRGKPKPELKVESDKCALCGKEEKARFFCKPCFRRLVWRYGAILWCIGCVPAALLVAYIVHLLGGADFVDAVSITAPLFILSYVVMAFAYFIVYARERTHVFLFGFRIDVRGIRFTLREEWWRFKLLLKQVLGQSKPLREDDPEEP
jgi:hypothetical protein